MKVIILYYCNSCENLGFEVLENIKRNDNFYSISEQIRNKLRIKPLKCDFCHAPSKYLKQIRVIEKKYFINFIKEENLLLTD